MLSLLDRKNSRQIPQQRFAACHDDQSSGITSTLTGIPETMLWPLYNRAVESRRKNALLRDDKAVQIADAIKYPFEEHFGAPDQIHVLRALRFDEQIRLFLKEYPDATVVALGDGLETEFWRVDNGRMKWLSVDLSESIEIRRRFLPDSERHRNLVCSALDLTWMDDVDPARGVLVTAQGLLMYFEPDQVRDLISAIAQRFPGGWMLFDVIPRWFSENTLRGYQKTRTYVTPPMPWGLDVNELQTILKFHPNIADVREIDMGIGRGYRYRIKLPILKRLPIAGNRRTSFVRLRFRPTAPQAS
jgi:O-methyltransferase involved in polyketide biosynthesis